MRPVASTSTRHTRLAALSLVLLASAPVWASEPVTVEQLQEQIRQLQDRLKALEEAAVSRPSEADIQRTRDAIQKDVAEQEDRRRVKVRYDNGLIFTNDEGNFSLRPSLGTQFRYVATAGASSDFDTESGFEFRRIRPRVRGTVFSKDLSYDVQLDVNRNGGSVSVLDAFVQYQFVPGWSVKAGQFKAFFSQERNLSPFTQLAVDRSIVDSQLGGAQVNRVQGLALVYGQGEKPLRWEIALHDGAGSGNTDFRDGNTDYGAGGRVEYKLMGKWSQYRDFSARRNDQPLLVFGAGADFTGAGDVNTLRTTGDAQLEFANGLGFFAAVHGNFTSAGSPPSGVSDSDRFDYGALVQAGYAFAKAWEVFGRYAVIVLDEDFVGGDNAYHEITTGVNYFFGPQGAFGHNAKITADVVYLPNGVPVNDTGLGILRTDEASFVFRVQLSLQI